MGRGRIGESEWKRTVGIPAGERCLANAFCGHWETMPLGDRIAHAWKRRQSQATAAVTVTGFEPELVRMAAFRAALLLACKNREPDEWSVSMAFPEATAEAEMKPFVRELLKAAKEAERGGAIALGDVVLSRADVAEPVITVTAAGKGRMCEGQTDTVQKNKEGRDTGQTDACEIPQSEGYALVMAGYAAMEGTILLYRQHERRLRERYAGHFLAGIDAMASLLYPREALDIALRQGAVYAAAFGEGGVFDGLWALAGDLHAGLRVSLPLIPVRQETIEVCEVLDLNPYRLQGGGSVLLVVPAAEVGALLAALAAADIRAANIGSLHTGNDKILENDGEIRYLEPFREEERFHI